MKILKSGKIKLEEGDYRISNFVISDESEHVKVQDISRTVVFRISKSIAQGQLLSMLLEDARKGGSTKGLESYIAVMYSALVCVPDATFLNEVLKSVRQCLDRNKAVYSVKDDISKEDDDIILEEEKERLRAEDEVREAVRKEKEEGARD